MGTASLVAVVDDDESVRESLPDLLRELGYAVETYSSAQGFLTSEAPTRADCLVVDVGMPGMSGPDLQLELIRRQQGIPIVFVTATRNESIRSQVIGRGAVDCLFKPFSEDDLIRAIAAALGTHRA